MKLLTNLDLSKNQILNATLQNLTIPPGSPTVGQIYYNTADQVAYYYSEFGWISIEDKNFIFVQGTPSAVWVINHGLNKIPTYPTIIDSGGNVVIGGEVHIVDNNNLTITFSAAFSGEASFN